MSDVYTAAELAARGLPGMPTSARGIRLRAQREGWSFVTRGPGEAIAYTLASLPSAVQRMLQEPAPSTPVDAWSAPEKFRLIATSRLNAVVAVCDLVERGESIGRGIDTIATERSLSARTLRRWVDVTKGAPRHQWLSLLTPTWRNPRAPEQTIAMPEDAWLAFRSDYLRASKPGFAACYQRLVGAAPARGWTLPSLATFVRRFKAETKQSTLVLKREGPKALARMYPAQTRTRDHFGALEAVTADGHKIDVSVMWPGAKEPERPMLLAVQDLASGKIIAWRLDRSENADLVRLVFGDVVRDFGIPDHVYFDNGRAFASKRITGGMSFRHRFRVKAEESQGLLTQLGVQVHWATPEHGQAKPIERAFGTLAEHIAKHPFCEGAYVGRSVANKPWNYGARAIPSEEMIAHIATQVAEHNARPGRKAVQGRSFDEVFFESYAKSPIRKATAEQQRLFLLSSEDVVANRETGAVTLLQTRYWCDALTELKGQRVTLRYDPDALASGVHVYRPSGEYIAHAEAITAVRFNDTAAARDHARARTAFAKAHKAIATAESTLTAADLAAFHAKARTSIAVEAPTTKVVRPVFGKKRAPELAESPGLASRDARDRKAKADALFEEVTNLSRNLVPKRRTPLAAGE